MGELNFTSFCYSSLTVVSEKSEEKNEEENKIEFLHCIEYFHKFIDVLLI